MKVKSRGHADELCTSKVNALIECLSVILESIDLILVGLAFECTLLKVNVWGITNNPSSILLH